MRYFHSLSLLLYFLRSFLLLCLPVTLSGQDWTVVADDWHFETQMGKEPVSAMDIYSKIQGTPFLEEDFVDGSLITRDSLMYQGVPLRYNIFKDEMEFLVAEEDVPRVIASPRNFLFYYLEDKIFEYLTFRDNSGASQGFFEVMNPGECQVLLRRRTDYAEPEGARGFDPAKPARFAERRDTYYLRFGRGIPVEIRFRRRSILDAFGEKQSEIANFVSDNNLSYRKPDDLVRMAEYYNQTTAD